MQQMGCRFSTTFTVGKAKFIAEIAMRLVTIVTLTLTLPLARNHQHEYIIMT